MHRPDPAPWLLIALTCARWRILKMRRPALLTSE
jgi:hypothetical protein